jgi:hypothetical protein
MGRELELIKIGKRIIKWENIKKKYRKIWKRISIIEYGF